MNQYGSITKKARGMAAAAAFVFTLASVTPVFAAGNQAAEVHQEFYQNIEYTALDGMHTEHEEIYLPAAEDDTYGRLEYAEPEAEIVAPALSEEEHASINWSVEPNVRMVTKTFYVKAGQKISISCTVSPASSSYWIGIMDPGNDVRYVTGTGSLSHEFTVQKSGFHRVLVQNNSSVTITATGAYMYYTP